MGRYLMTLSGRYLRALSVAVAVGSTAAAGAGFGAGATVHAPYPLSRIYWDLGSKVRIMNGGYCRIWQLQDGRLMCVSHAGTGVSASYSSDGGASWTPAQVLVAGVKGVNQAVPDVTQTSDGTIIVGYNPRPQAPYSEERRFGIRTIRSTDGGETWEAPVYVYDASYTFDDGCWEPSFLELPSGELQLYFANEGPFTSNNDQEISVSRSFDQGQTWSEPTRVSYRAGHRDGMPAAILTPRGEIVVTVEDNGNPGYSNFRVTTVRCPLEENWSTWVDATSSRRSMIFANEADKQSVSAAPYLRQLKTGETVASWQGNKGRNSGDLNYFDVFVAVGDSDARNFQAISQPMHMPLTGHSIWNSVAVDREGAVYVLGQNGATGSGTPDGVVMMKGYPAKGFAARYGTPTVDGNLQKAEGWLTGAKQVNLGGNAGVRSNIDFLYDEQNLYVYFRSIDRTIFTDKVDDDGLFLYFDPDNQCQDTPKKREYRIFMDVNGTVRYAQGRGSGWGNEAVPEGLTTAVNVRSTYYDIEARIPWTALGIEAAAGAPLDRLMRMGFEVRDRKADDTILEKVPDATDVASWTWPEFRLTTSPDYGGVEDVIADSRESKVSVAINGGQIQASSADGAEISSLKVYTPQGALVRAESNSDSVSTAGLTGVVIVAVTAAQRAPQAFIVQI